LAVTATAEIATPYDPTFTAATAGGSFVAATDERGTLPSAETPLMAAAVWLAVRASETPVPVALATRARPE